MLVVVDGVVKQFGQGDSAVRGLRGFSLEVSAGEVCAVVGVSGSGKSTLLNVVGAVFPFDAGTVTVAGIDVGGLRKEGLSRYRREVVSTIFQEYNLLEMLTAIENVMLPGLIVGADSKDVRSAAEACLGEMGLQDYSDRYPGELSGGQRQRTAIAQTMLGQRVAGKSVLLADEPTGALDLESTKQVMAAFRTAADHGLAVLIATHDPLVTSLSDRVVSIRDGLNFD